MRNNLALIVVLPVLLLLLTSAHAQKTPDDCIMRAVGYMQNGDNKSALAEVTEAIKLRPDFADAYMLRSTLKSMSEDQKGALEDLDKFIELRPTSGKGRYQRAIYRLMSNDSTGARKDLDAAIANGFKEDYVYELRAQLRINDGDVSGSLADLDDAIKINSGNATYYLRRASIHMEAKNQDLAFSDLTHVINWYEAGPQKPAPKLKADPRAPVASPATPNSPVDNTAKVEISTETVNPSPTDKEMVTLISDAYDRRAAIHSERGNIDAALADLTKSIRMVPGAGNYMRRAFEQERKGNLDGALADVGQAMQLMTNCGSCKLEHGVILVLQGKQGEAQADFDELIKAGYATQARVDQSIEAARKRLLQHTN